MESHRIRPGRAGRTDLRPGLDGTVLVDVDDSIVEVHGHAKQSFGYTLSLARPTSQPANGAALKHRLLTSYSQDMPAEDHVDEIVALWKEREPDMDATSLHVVGRLLRAAADINRLREAVLGEFGLTVGDFDVLATLLRTSGPAGLNAKHLSRSALITSGAMTTRLDRLERAGLVERRPDPDDRRGVLVRLTRRGQKSAGEAVRAVLSAHDDYLRGLPERDRDRLVAALRKLLMTAG